ncbi:hypothetical protein [Alkalisalibacterium limincola]|uniref:Uncharacterized protein n=1 Tax=Alkalisalibacterium limincola TaxID=2699169 RepID=A0A5C8KU43_9GAMM|nr:hypothetical protein [Alkalisalibacterium limincola]TXK64361.1 hypothetical protein FU658_05530 [Alkalisalibacterium limincola]
MRVALRLFIMLVAVPGALLWLAWELAQVHPAPAAPTSVSAAGNPAPPTAVDAQPTRAELAGEIVRQRRERAAQCVGRGLRVANPDMRGAKLTLVVATSTGCRHGCEAERIAERLNDDYTLEGLRVMLLRTDDDGRMDTPMGVSTVVVPDCAPLFAPLGHDYFLRHADGSLSSSGERHEAALLYEVGLEFDPEPLVRRHLNLRN